MTSQVGSHYVFHGFEFIESAASQSKTGKLHIANITVPSTPKIREPEKCQISNRKKNNILFKVCYTWVGGREFNIGDKAFVVIDIDGREISTRTKSTELLKAGN